MAHKFSVFDFSDKEIDQICALVKRWVQGYTSPIDARKFTKQVREWGIAWGILAKKHGRLYTQGDGFSALHNMPVEALWRMVEPMLREDGTTGYSVVNNKGWDLLNIYPQNSKYASGRDLDAKIDVLLKLSQWHYIHFQMAGSTWAIYPENKLAA